MSESILIVHTRQLLKERPRQTTYAKIEQDTKLSSRWLAQFAQDSTGIDFGATKVELLYTYLSGKTLKL